MTRWETGFKLIYLKFLALFKSKLFFFDFRLTRSLCLSRSLFILGTVLFTVNTFSLGMLIANQIPKKH